MLFFLIWLNLLFPIENEELINQAHDFFDIDHLGYIYTIKNTEIIKYDLKGQKLCNFSNPQMGNITSIDITDPLRIQIFFKDFNQLIYLDKNLAEIGNPINLYDFSDNETELTCLSQKGGFWIYNSVDNQVKHISSNGTPLTESMLLGSFFGESSIEKVKEYNNNLYILFKNKGILQLDENGQFIQKISITNIIDFQVVKNKIFYQLPTGLFEFQPQAKNDLKLLEKNSSVPLVMKVRNQQIYISNTKSISIKHLSF